ncbi:MAG: phospholipid carrier-dependent glycosyltransferase [Myxococcaceae bacterium]|nr:MAG: phospholipid carrier-dependent glycosyltransferase [Myxococcaceae bacterium]
MNQPSGTESSPSELAVPPSATRPETPDAEPARKAAPRYGRRAALVIVVAGVFYALLARVALQGYPYSGDEYSTVLQAEGFARGALKARAPPFADWARVDHVIIDEFVRSKYPPGTAALLAPGVRAGVPWLVTPLEAMLTLVAFWFASRVVFDERRAFLAVAFLATMPLFAYQAATFLSHVPTLLFGALAMLAVARWGRSRRDGWLVLFGFSVGCVFLIRPVDAALLGLSLIAFPSLRALVIAGASAMPFVGLQLWYNALQYGSPFTDGYAAGKPGFVAIYGESGATANISLRHLFSPLQIFHHLAELETFFFQWTVPGAALLACLGWVALRREQAAGDGRTASLQRFFGVMMVLFLAGLLLTFNEPDDSPRPRYLSMVLLPVAFLAAAGWDGAASFVQRQLGRRTSWVIGVAMWIAPLFLMASYLEHRIPEVKVHTGLSEELAREGVRSGVVILRAEWPTRYARNGMFFDRSPLLLSLPAKVPAAEVAARFPGQPVYEAFEPHGANPWKHPWVIRRVQ